MRATPVRPFKYFAALAFAVTLLSAPSADAAYVLFEHVTQKVSARGEVVVTVPRMRITGAAGKRVVVRSMLFKKRGKKFPFFRKSARMATTVPAGLNDAQIRAPQTFRITIPASGANSEFILRLRSFVLENGRFKRSSDVPLGRIRMKNGRLDRHTRFFSGIMSGRSYSHRTTLKSNGPVFNANVVQTESFSFRRLLNGCLKFEALDSEASAGSLGFTNQHAVGIGCARFTNRGLELRLDRFCRGTGENVCKPQPIKNTNWNTYDRFRIRDASLELKPKSSRRTDTFALRPL